MKNIHLLALAGVVIWLIVGLATGMITTKEPEEEIGPVHSSTGSSYIDIITDWMSDAEIIK